MRTSSYRTQSIYIYFQSIDFLTFNRMQFHSMDLSHPCTKHKIQPEYSSQVACIWSGCSFFLHHNDLPAVCTPKYICKYCHELVLRCVVVVVFFSHIKIIIHQNLYIIPFYTVRLFSLRFLCCFRAGLMRLPCVVH